MNHNMNPESDNSHVTALIPDYVLDLLAREEQRHVATHVATCRRCRQAVYHERQLLFAVRDTYSTATRPDPARLSRLRPAIPQSGLAAQPFWLRPMVQALGRPLVRALGRPMVRAVGQPLTRPLAATLLLLLVIIGSLALQSGHNEGIWRPTSPGVVAATAAVTDTPTLTATSTAQRQAGQPTASPELPTPLPIRAPVRAAVRAVSPPRPAAIPVAIPPLLR